MTKLDIGDVLPRRKLTTIRETLVEVPGAERLVHLQFRRYAGCPLCNLHLRSVTQRYDEIVAAGVDEVVVFHSSAEVMRRFQGELPFAAIADPDKALYAEFGVRSSPKAVLSPRVWPKAMGAMAKHRTLNGDTTLQRVGGAMSVGEKHFGLPADFLISPDGRVLARKYGRHGSDQWSVDELLALAATHSPT